MQLRCMPAEYRSVLLILGLAAAGQLARWALLRPGEAPGGIVLVGASGPAGAPGAHRDSARTADRSLNEGEMVDLDRAGAAEIARLPGVGPGLARRIVLYREAHGAFGGLERLDSIPGVGKSLLEKIGPHARFSGLAAPAAPPPGATPAEHPVTDPNTASSKDLARLPWVGPGRAAAIVAYREAHGPFASVEGLAAVPGIGPATIAKLRPFLQIR